MGRVPWLTNVWINFRYFDDYARKKMELVFSFPPRFSNIFECRTDDSNLYAKFIFKIRKIRIFELDVRHSKVCGKFLLATPATGCGFLSWKNRSTLVIFWCKILDLQTSELRSFLSLITLTMFVLVNLFNKIYVTKMSF